jgi:hypothetical protein
MLSARILVLNKNAVQNVGCVINKELRKILVECEKGNEKWFFVSLWSFHQDSIPFFWGLNPAQRESCAILSSLCLGPEFAVYKLTERSDFHNFSHS